MAASRQALRDNATAGKPDPTTGAFFWLSAFFVVYCVRPEDWLPGLAYIPLAKISAIFAVIALVAAIGRTKRSFKDLPRESKYLLAMIALLFLWCPLSPVWKGGALMRTIEFAKVYIAWVLTYLLVTNVARLRRLIFIQASSVAVVALISMIKGSSGLRLQGVLNGIYGNPNDLAFAIVLTLPLILLLLLTSKNTFLKVLWGGSMLIMLYTLFLTASRAGFIDLIISAPIALWFFGVKGKRPQLIIVSLVMGVMLLVVAGRHLRDRLVATTGSNIESAEEQTAYGSYEERKFLMFRALYGIVHYPLTGVGTGVFPAYSTRWKQVHMTYLQIAVEGGLPVLILYLLFFRTGFKKLRNLLRKPDPNSEVTLFAWALCCCLVGFVVGACFAPEAYQFFPYFTVAYISALTATVQEKEREAKARETAPAVSGRRLGERYGNYGEPRPVQFVR